MKDKVLKWVLMRIRAEKPTFSEVDDEYVIPVRFSSDYAHELLTGWAPMGGLGWAHLRPREDGSFDIFVRAREMSEDLNLVRLDAVETALMASLDLARSVLENEEEFDEDTLHAAASVSELVKIAAE